MTETYTAHDKNPNEQTYTDGEIVGMDENGASWVYGHVSDEVALKEVASVCLYDPDWSAPSFSHRWAEWKFEECSFGPWGPGEWFQVYDENATGRFPVTEVYDG